MIRSGLIIMIKDFAAKGKSAGEISRDAYAAAKLQSNRSSPTPRPLKSDTLSAGPTVGVVSVETGLFVSLHAA